MAQNERLRTNAMLAHCNVKARPQQLSMPIPEPYAESRNTLINAPID